MSPSTRLSDAYVAGFALKLAQYRNDSPSLFKDASLAGSVGRTFGRGVVNSARRLFSGARTAISSPSVRETLADGASLVRVPSVFMATFGGGTLLDHIFRDKAPLRTFELKQRNLGAPFLRKTAGNDEGG